jgi:UDP-sulfoquinovose synthase
MHPDLVNRFDYDGDYGTVLNRFLIQAAVGHPLTVHGTGGQTRAFIHIRNTVECIKLAIENPPLKEEKVKVFNQVTETHTIKDLAELVSASTGAEIRFYNNPRNEADKNELEVSNDMFLGLGLNPITLKDGLLAEILDVARKHEDRVDQSHIIAKSLWSKEHEVDEIGKVDEPK